MPAALLREVIVPRDCMWLPDDDATFAGPGTEGPLLRGCPALSLAFGPPPQANGLSSTCMAGVALLMLMLNGHVKCTFALILIFEAKWLIGWP